MSDATSVSAPRWPFFLGDATLLAFAGVVFFWHSAPPDRWELAVCALCVALGAALGIWPYLLDHRERVKRIETEALGGVVEKLQHLERLAAQISSATNEWQNVHLQAEKAAGSAQEITDRMAAEVRDFSAFMQKANDTEKTTLRLEVEKLHRAEMDWLQSLVFVLDHVFALHAGAVRSGKTELIEQLTHFRNACQESVRRVGLVAFVPAPGDAFDPARHQCAEGGDVPANARIAEPMAVGFTLQGRIVRPAFVRLATVEAAKPASPELRDPESPPPPAAGETQLTLETPDPTGAV